MDLIEARGGLFTMIDEIVRTPGKMETKDAKLSETLDKKFASCDFYVENRSHQLPAGSSVFSVHHYAGTVTYQIQGMVVKNLDSLYPDLYTLMTNSSTPFVADLFPAEEGGGGGGGSGRKLTLGARFKKSVTSLMDKLRSTAPHCAKILNY